MAKSSTSYRKAVTVNVSTDKNIQPGQAIPNPDGTMGKYLYERVYDGKKICLRKNASKRFLEIKKLAPDVKKFLMDPNAVSMLIDTMTDETEKERLRIAARHIELHLEGHDG